jgi:6-pyruvoyltetrahydropterin/6-carboxytetrahydropterin synthase
MYELTVSCHFDAAHSLRGYPGECYRLHGHTWNVEATVAGNELDELGILYDFKLLKQDLNSVLERYDHMHINDIPPFTEISPTAENLAKVIYERLAQTVAPSVALLEVSVWESPVAKLTYRP